MKFLSNTFSRLNARGKSISAQDMSVSVHDICRSLCLRHMSISFCDMLTRVGGAALFVFCGMVQLISEMLIFSFLLNNALIFQSVKVCIQYYYSRTTIYKILSVLWKCEGFVCHWDKHKHTKSRKYKILSSSVVICRCIAITSYICKIMTSSEYYPCHLPPWKAVRHSALSRIMFFFLGYMTNILLFIYLLVHKSITSKQLERGT